MRTCDASVSCAPDQLRFFPFQHWSVFAETPGVYEKIERQINAVSSCIHTTSQQLCPLMYAGQDGNGATPPIATHPREGLVMADRER